MGQIQASFTKTLHVKFMKCNGLTYPVCPRKGRSQRMMEAPRDSGNKSLVHEES